MITQFDTQIPTKNFAGTRAKAKNKEAQASALFRSPMYFEDAGSPPSPRPEDPYPPISQASSIAAYTQAF
jgi:hypothetical protein